MIVTVDEATSLAVELLVRAGVPPDAAAEQAELLVVAEAKGAASHGLLRLPRLLRRIEGGVLNPCTRGSHEWVAAGHLRVDGEQGLGPVVALAALRTAIPVARTAGVALVTIHSANHLGMLSWYTERLAHEGLVTIAATTSEALVHPWGGTAAVVGTNPLSVSVPARQPVVLDMATSEVSMGKVHDLASRGHPLQPGWALDASGSPTTDAEAAKSGALAPLGVKGYALGVTLGALVGHLTGAANGAEVHGTLDDHHPASKGDVFVVIDAGGAPVDDYLDHVRSSRRADPALPVRIPGDGATERRRRAERDGLDVADHLWSELASLHVRSGAMTTRGEGSLR